MLSLRNSEKSGPKTDRCLSIKMSYTFEETVVVEFIGGIKIWIDFVQLLNGNCIL